METSQRLVQAFGFKVGAMKQVSASESELAKIRNAKLIILNHGFRKTHNLIVGEMAVKDYD